MLLVEYTSIRGVNIPVNANKSTWNILHSFIDSQNQILISEYPGGGLQSITRLQSQCDNMKVSDNNRYNRLFQKVVHKRGE